MDLVELFKVSIEGVSIVLDPESKTLVFKGGVRDGDVVLMSDVVKCVSEEYDKIFGRVEHGFD